MDPFVTYHAVGAPGARLICAALGGLESSLRACDAWSPGCYQVLLGHWEPSSGMHYSHWGVAVKHADGSVDLIADQGSCVRVSWPADEERASLAPDRRFNRSFGGSMAMANRKKTGESLSDQLRERIRHWTEENACSLYELATAAGVDRSVVCRFVAGERNINLTTADRLAAVLRVRLADDR
jgi:hypothetical protein